MDEFRTNISIKDKMAWDYVKLRKNKFNSKTISNELFRLINNYRNSPINIDLVNFLILMERFYEMYSFTIKDVQNELQISQKILFQMIEKYLGDVKVHGNLSKQDVAYARKKIHITMDQFSIQSQEYLLLHKLTTLFKFEDLSDEQKIITILYENVKQRQAEIYNYLIILLDDLLERKINLQIFKKDWKKYQHITPQFSYYKYGIELPVEDYEDDIVSDILKEEIDKEDVFPCYSFLIDFAVSHLISKNMIFLKEYIAQNYIISDKFIPLINKTIDALNNIDLKENLGIKA